jgi:iron-sulfur cluster assembly protein
MAKEVAPGEQVFEAHDAKLVVTADAMPIVDGSELDYVREGFKQMFTVKNPNAKSTCGCGESFSV